MVTYDDVIVIQLWQFSPHVDYAQLAHEIRYCNLEETVLQRDKGLYYFINGIMRISDLVL